VKERIAAPMTQDRPDAGSAVLAAGVICVMEGKAGPSRLLQRSWGPGIVSENSGISQKKQPFMKDFSSSGFAIRELCDG